MITQLHAYENISSNSSELNPRRFIEPKSLIPLGIPLKLEDDEVCIYIKNEVNISKQDLDISDKCYLEYKLIKIRKYN